ncbi:uncharacterized protein F5Z01DRAFT_745981 [Emericellopsis atlantica]|uniref:Uncharacterized protein n=1 Tax=Emericellopsis atlantica TaxID=2614577 RepID=A0A9P7ZCY2_9HYPO|nr:uncharacterized protein F5Z01DRAFT_745981 [Emericellopsis atlantica]KAG9249715.1 hypothetical protein F5Z01DRAFT_745981 [Emericellopsis atlantica]
MDIQFLQFMREIESHLFFSQSRKGPSDMDTHSRSSPQGHETPSPSGGASPTGEDDSNRVDFAQGRVLYIFEQNSQFNRAILLLLYGFCIRLHHEDYAYIRAFIERHLSLRCVLQRPYHWQQKSTPELSSSRQKCYRRVTVSFHMTYLTLDANEMDGARDVFDRASLFPFIHKPGIGKQKGKYIFQASASVLLTLTVPEESESHEEELSLLQHPQALWVVLVINAQRQFVFENRPAQHSTPIAQFIRGVRSSLYSQRMHAQSIYNALSEALKTCDNGCLFDDENFSKSTLYHFAIKACDELEASIASSLVFMRRTLNNYVTRLCKEAHPCEQTGIGYWSQKMEEETIALEDLEAQIHKLGSQARESRNALNGVTAVLEARAALQQGERMKSLAYLATIYLPLTAAASLYSMSVLPESASFASFLIFFAILFFFTILLGLNLSVLSALPAKTARYFRRRSFAKRQRDLSPTLPSWMENYINAYISLLDRSSNVCVIGFDYGLTSRPNGFLWWIPYLLYRFMFFVFRTLPALVLRHCLIPEILYPRYQWLLFQFRHNRYVTIVFHPALFVIDAIRFSLVPAWVVLAACIICYLVLQDAFIGIFNFKPRKPL